MKFSAFFHSWLHDNYYKNGVSIGKNGDFYTSVSVGSLFGLTLAFYFVRLFRQGKISANADIVEIGANDGSMICDFVQGIFNFAPELLNTLNFNIIEPHQKLRDLQMQNFTKSFDNKLKLNHFCSLNECDFNEAFFISNELFDSFDCEIIDGSKMLFIGDNGEFLWQEMDRFTSEISKKFGVKKGELSLGFDEFAMSVKRAAKKSRFISFDYGDNFARNDFSIRIFKEHKVYNFFEIADFKPFFGLSDITYSLNFNQLEVAFNEASFIKTAYKKQGTALVDMGILEILQIAKEKGGQSAYEKFLKQFKFIFNPEFLGDKFKMIEFVLP
ncbi:MAG: SAM-dependent methyltransferase [Campylobacter sp.]